MIIRSINASNLQKEPNAKVGERITIGTGPFRGREATAINIHSYYYSDFDKKRDEHLETNIHPKSGGISVCYQSETGIIWLVRFDDKTTTTIIDDEIAEREK